MNIPIILLATIPDDPAFSSFGTMFLNTVLVTVLVVGLALLILRFLLPRLGGMRRNKTSRIQIEDYQALDARRAVYILNIAGKRVAVGATEHSVNRLCDLES